MLNNALIERYRYSLLRPRQCWVFLAAYLLVVGLLLFINSSIYRRQDVFHNWAEFFRALYYQFLLLQVAVLWVTGACNTGAALKEERLQKSYDFFRMLPLSAVDKAVGILVGKNLVALLMAGGNFVFLLTFGVLGRVNGILQLQFLLLLLSVALALNIGTLMLSTYTPAKQEKRSGLSAVLFLGFFAIPAIINAFIATTSGKSPAATYVPFFGFPVPLLVMISLLAIYFSGWMFKGVTRLLSRENDPLFSRRGGAGFLLAHIVIVLGFAWTFLQGNHVPQPVYVFWLASLFPLLFIPLGSVTTFDRYLEEAGRAGAPGVGAFLRQANLSYWLGLGGLWALAAVAVGVMTGFRIERALFEAGILLSFCLVFLLLLELSVLYTPLYGRVGILIAIVVLIVLFLPLVIAAIFENNSLFAFCLPGFWVELFSGPREGRLPLFGLVLGCNLALSLVPLWLVFRRYHFIVTARREM